MKFVSSDGIRTRRSSALSGSLSEQYNIKNNRLYKMKMLLSAANTVSSSSLRFVLDSVSNLRSVSYFASSKTSNYIMFVFRRKNFIFRSISMTVNSKQESGKYYLLALHMLAHAGRLCNYTTLIADNKFVVFRNS
jgi:hypothetical protein